MVDETQEVRPVPPPPPPSPETWPSAGDAENTRNQPVDWSLAPPEARPDRPAPVDRPVPADRPAPAVSDLPPQYAVPEEVPEGSMTIEQYDAVKAGEMSTPTRQESVAPVPGTGDVMIEETEAPEKPAESAPSKPMPQRWQKF